MKKIGLSLIGSCKCGADQTASHVLRCTTIFIKEKIAKVDKPLENGYQTRLETLKSWNVHTHIHILTLT